MKHTVNTEQRRLIKTMYLYISYTCIDMDRYEFTWNAICMAGGNTWATLRVLTTQGSS